MTEDPHLVQLREQFQEITNSCRELKKNRAGAHLLAATPQGREQLVAHRHKLAEYRRLLAGMTREMADADRILEKALGKRGWGIRV